MKNRVILATIELFCLEGHRDGPVVEVAYYSYKFSQPYQVKFWPSFEVYDQDHPAEKRDSRNSYVQAEALANEWLGVMTTRERRRRLNGMSKKEKAEEFWLVEDDG